jgi:hypothetical protein
MSDHFEWGRILLVLLMLALLIGIPVVVLLWDALKRSRAEERESESR